MNFDQPHRRQNLLTGEWVLVSPHRAKRPWQGKNEEEIKTSSPPYDASCYLCPGNERASGNVNPTYESTYVFTNDFPALLPDKHPEDWTSGLLNARAEPGTCRVVCFSPDHSLTIPELSHQNMVDVVKTWINEYKTLGGFPNINHVQIFENKGAIMGCSNPHPHGQIWAQHSIPETVQKKSLRQRQHYNSKGKSLLSEYLEQELKNKTRIISENENFVSLVPFWAVWPYEAMIIPRSHMINISYMKSAEIESFSVIIQDLTRRLDGIFNVSFPYSAGIHQSPTDGKNHKYWHWHMSFYPPLLRSATVKKFMVGYEMFAEPQRDITAESAAATLRQMGV